MSSDTLLSDLNAAGFFQRYWQRQPLLLRGLIDVSALTAVNRQWLHRAAEDSNLDSRRVTGPDKSGDYQVEFGPGLDSRSASAQLPWTLLVRDVDKVCEEADALLDAFSVVGRWRMEDIMVSYATQGGSVGAHLDQYDVFLIQTSGQRNWQIDSTPDPDTHHRADQELSLLSQFQPNQHWVLEPGDCLYLPPGVPHHGVALGGDDCITWSVGLRTPSAAELWVGFAEYQFSQSGEDQRLRDPYRNPSQSGQIVAQDLQQVRDLLGGLRGIDDAALARWFGCHVTQTSAQWQAEGPCRPSGAYGWCRAPGALLAWYVDDRHGWLFANGIAHECSRVDAALISSQRRIPHEQWANLHSTLSADTLDSLLEDGIFVPCD